MNLVPGCFPARVQQVAKSEIGSRRSSMESGPIGSRRSSVESGPSGSRRSSTESGKARRVAQNLLVSIRHKGSKLEVL